MTKFRVKFIDGEIRIYDRVMTNDSWVTAWDEDDTNKISYPVHQIMWVEQFEQTQPEFVREPGSTWNELRNRAI